MTRAVPAIPLEGDLPGSAAGHAFAEVADALVRKHDGRGTVLITSAETGAGRSTTAANLSLAFLAKSYTVLLLELTETRPRMEEVFGVSPNRHGVESVLAGRRQLDAVICRRLDNGLYLSVMKAASALDLASSARVTRVQELLRYAGERFDWTVIDGPSRADGASVAVLAESVSQVIVVGDRRNTRRSSLAAMLNALAEYSPYVLLTN